MRAWFLIVVLAGALPIGCGNSSDSQTIGGASGSAGSTAGTQTTGGTGTGGSSGAGGTGGVSGSAGANAGSSQGGSSGTASGGSSQGGGSGDASGGSAQGGSSGDGSGGSAQGGSSGDGPLDCDHRKITCRRAEPACPVMQVPRVDGTCYGECVPIMECGCTVAEDCPHEESYTCHRSAMRCGPYL